MKQLIVKNGVIPYVITKKQNKNTYFYFKKEGFIQINLSKFQTEKDIIQYMKQNSSKFLNKLKNTVKIVDEKQDQFLYKGTIYKIVKSQTDKVEIDDNKNLIYLPTTDKNSDIVRAFYKKQMLELTNELHNKYKSNKYVDITGVKYRTRYTTSRHGSCNARLRTINLNLNLIKYDPIYTEYVYLHEIAHLSVQNHSKKYYQLLEKLCPNYKELRKKLKQIYR